MEKNDRQLSVQELRVIRRMAELFPIHDKMEVEKKQIDQVEFSKVVTFITPRHISKEIAFYYIIHNQIVDFVKLFTAEKIKDIYFHSHPEYTSIYDVKAPIIVILLGSELYNSQMITILNLFIQHFLSYQFAKSLIFIYEGSIQEFKIKYKNAQERGILNSGKSIFLAPPQIQQASKVIKNSYDDSWLG